MSSISFSDMSYVPVLSPIRTYYDDKWKVFCPKCKKQRVVRRSWNSENTYGCIDGSYVMELTCNHIINSWELYKK